ncbi:hypothetical protein [Synechococcus sp. CS-1328]|uniref:hypothetical protein n=1 Tax=Synechococcus sp. CS-1328 TaxID=2847976 RepID=UPI00223A6B4C|nr:hypothetical protein [Synechococcus sp. CS-1328]MCT0225521.1 hypothetical protein [Synechococcus sp. CS-1328]
MKFLPVLAITTLGLGTLLTPFAAEATPTRLLQGTWMAELQEAEPETSQPVAEDSEPVVALLSGGPLVDGSTPCARPSCDR